MKEQVPVNRLVNDIAGFLSVPLMPGAMLFISP